MIGEAVGDPEKITRWANYFEHVYMVAAWLQITNSDPPFDVTTFPLDEVKKGVIRLRGGKAPSVSTS